MAKRLPKSYRAPRGHFRRAAEQPEATSEELSGTTRSLPKSCRAARSHFRRTIGRHEVTSEELSSSPKPLPKKLSGIRCHFGSLCYRLLASMLTDCTSLFFSFFFSSFSILLRKRNDFEGKTQCLSAVANVSNHKYNYQDTNSKIFSTGAFYGVFFVSCQL